MNYLQKKKLAFMSIVNSVKGFVRTITGTLPLTLEGCVDEESIIDYTLYGQSVQNGTPAPEAPVEVESVGEKIVNLFSGYEESFDGYYADTGDLVTTLSIRTVQYIPVKPNTVYTVRGRCTKTFKTGIIRVVQFNNDKAFIRRNVTSQAYRPIVTFTTTEDASFLAICYDNDETGVIATVTDIQIDEGAVPMDYNLYNKYKIPIKVSGNDKTITTNIYLDEPLGEGQSINYKRDGLPTIPTFKGTSIISADTTIQPSNAEIEYYSNVKE